MPDLNPQPVSSPPERMQCMEVWGGNRRVDKGFEMPGLRVWVHSRPYERSERGGDVYYISSCASGRITRMLLADVSGHGNAVADIAVGLRDLMRRNVNLIKQSRFVRAMNRQFSAQSKEGGFATALVCTFFAPTRTLQLCNAGHPTPLVYRKSQAQWGFAEQQTASKQGAILDVPLGVIQEADYSQSRFGLEPGDLMLCFSDAFTESTDRGTEMQLGSEGLLELVATLDPSEPQVLIPQLIDRIRAKNSENLAQDDATVLLFEATGTRPTLAENLLAPYRYMRGVRDKELIL